MSRLVILLPPDADTPLAWLTVEDGAVLAQGTGESWPRHEDAIIRAMLVAPASVIALHRALLPDLAARQAQAAARLMAVENALGDPEALHVASGPRESDGALDVAVVANADMVAWLTWAEARGLDAGPVVPAALLLPRPDDGFVRGRIGAETIARDKSAAFAVDPALAGLVIGDAPVADVPAADVEAVLIAALDDPPLDLRQGPFARRKKRSLDWGLLKRLAIMLGLILLASLVMALVTIAKLGADSERLDARALAAARTVVPDASLAEQAQTALEERAIARGVGGRGFSATAARLFAALDQSPAAALTAFELTADGGVRATVAAPSVNDLDIAVAALRSSGAGAVTTPAQTGDGRQAIQITLGARPMIAHWKARWVMMTLRERVLILVMLGLMTVVVVWLGIVRPVNDGLANARAEHALAVDRAGRIDAAVIALRRTAGAAPVLEGALDQIVAQSATEAGFTLESQNLVGPDRMAIAIGSARPTALFSWLSVLETRGIGVETITVQPGASGTISARIMLRAAR